VFFSARIYHGQHKTKKRGKERASERERQTLITARFDGPVGLQAQRQREREREREHEMGERDYATVERA
jgi:hypothetical protein